ncbi:MAG: L-ribulose-5-phosphate 4-epimerase AraD [Planctomycetota bacterium]
MATSDDREIRTRVLQANRDLVRMGLVQFTWGNASAVDRARGLVYIKPSGVDTDTMTIDDIVAINLLDGSVVSGYVRPSTDTPTHLALYRAWPRISGVVHTHSEFATAMAQQGMGLPAAGNTHVCYFHGDIPVTRELIPDEIAAGYEASTGKAIVERFAQLALDPTIVPGVLVDQHAPYTWGFSVEQAVMHAGVLEFLAKAYVHGLSASPNRRRVSDALVELFYQRKHSGAKTHRTPHPVPPR